MTKPFSSLFAPLDPTDGSTAVSIIVKLTGETCNIDCLYCYEKRKPYPNSQILDPSVLGQWLDRLGNQPLAIELHGGEPLLFGRKRMQLLLQNLSKRPNILRLSLQTNGTLLTGEWLDLFDELAPKLQLGISLDGDEIANALRVDYTGRSSYRKTEAALELCSERNRSCGVISVVSAANVNRPDDLLRFFAAFSCIKALSFVPCFDYAISQNHALQPPQSLSRTNRNLRPQWAITPRQYLEFLRRTTDVWIEKGYFQQFLLEPIMSVIRRLEGRHTTFCHFTPQKCAHVLTMYPDGRIGSCDELPVPASILFQNSAPTLSEIATTINDTDLFTELRGLLEKCNSCSYQSICGGGCLATRLRFKPTLYDDEYCNFRTGLIDHIRNSVNFTAGTNV